MWIEHRHPSIRNINNSLPLQGRIRGVVTRCAGIDVSRKLSIVCVCFFVNHSVSKAGNQSREAKQGSKQHKKQRHQNRLNDHWSKRPHPLQQQFSPKNCSAGKPILAGRAKCCQHTPRPFIVSSNQAMLKDNPVGVINLLFACAALVNSTGLSEFKFNLPPPVWLPKPPNEVQLRQRPPIS